MLPGMLVIVSSSLSFEGGPASFLFTFTLKSCVTSFVPSLTATTTSFEPLSSSDGVHEIKPVRLSISIPSGAVCNE